MDIRIDSSNEVPIRRQLIEQIIFLIATERIKDGDSLPSVRELARRLKVHHNTVSEAYQDLVRRKWLERRRGSRLTAISREAAAEEVTLDDLINRTITMARENGHSLQQLRERVRERLISEAPDHVLVVEQDEGLRELICEELRSALKCSVEGCSREDLELNRAGNWSACRNATARGSASSSPGSEGTPGHSPALCSRRRAFQNHSCLAQAVGDCCRSLEQALP